MPALLKRLLRCGMELIDPGQIAALAKRRVLRCDESMPPAAAAASGDDLKSAAPPAIP